MPRFTAMPSRSSLATRMAMSSLVKPTGVMLWSLNDSLNVDSRGDDELRVELAWFDHVFDLGDRNLCGRGHDGVEVALRGVIDEVAVAVALRGLDDRVISDQCSLEDV